MCLCKLNIGCVDQYVNIAEHMRVWFIRTTGECRDILWTSYPMDILLLSAPKLRRWGKLGTLSARTFVPYFAQRVWRPYWVSAPLVHFPCLGCVRGSLVCVVHCNTIMTCPRSAHWSVPLMRPVARANSSDIGSFHRY